MDVITQVVCTISPIWLKWRQPSHFGLYVYQGIYSISVLQSFSYVQNKLWTTNDAIVTNRDSCQLFIRGGGGGGGGIKMLRNLMGVGGGVWISIKNIYIPML